MVESAEIYAASKGLHLSHEEWAKLQTCHHCGECGHIRPNCPKWKALPREDRHIPHNRQNRQSHYSKGHHNVDRRQQHDKGCIRSVTGQGNRRLHNFSDRDRRHLQRAARILSTMIRVTENPHLLPLPLQMTIMLTITPSMLKLLVLSRVH